MDTKIDLHPLISIIIPIYNNAKFLEKCLTSVLKQTYPHWQAICIDDGSPDNSAEILNKFAKQDERFLIISKQNGGVSSARNEGLKHADGEFVMFMDGDDFIHPQCFELAVNAMIKTRADICQFQFIHTDGKDTTFKQYDMPEHLSVEENPLENFLRRKFNKTVLIWDKIYKKEIAVQTLFRPISPGEDDLYSFEMLAHSNIFAKLDIPLYYYVKNPQSVIRSIDAQKYRRNRLMLADTFYQVIHELYHTLPLTPGCNLLLTRYLCNHFIFKEHILKTLRRNKELKNVDKEVAFLLAKFDEGFISRQMLKPRYRLVLWLLERHYYFLGRLVAG